MPTITPFLMFNGRLGEAMDFYASIFTDAEIVSAIRTPANSVMSATFELQGQRFMAFDGGPHFKFSEAISLFVSCDTQEEVDELWEKLSEGGEKKQCGWIQDKYGVSWQIIPTALSRLLGDKDPEKAKRVRDAMLQMTKIDIAGLERAYKQ